MTFPGPALTRDQGRFFFEKPGRIRGGGGGLPAQMGEFCLLFTVQKWVHAHMCSSLKQVYGTLTS